MSSIPEDLMTFVLRPLRVNEIQAFIVELVSNFEFALTDDIKRLRREPCGVMLPVLEGESGVKMPLRVTLALREE